MRILYDRKGHAGNLLKNPRTGKYEVICDYCSAAWYRRFLRGFEDCDSDGYATEDEAIEAWNAIQRKSDRPEWVLEAERIASREDQRWERRRDREADAD